MQEFGVLRNFKVFRKLFDIKSLKDGPGWCTLQYKSMAKNFITKLSLSIHGRKNGFLCIRDEGVAKISQWNRRKSVILPTSLLG